MVETSPANGEEASGELGERAWAALLVGLCAASAIACSSDGDDGSGGDAKNDGSVEAEPAWVQVTDDAREVAVALETERSATMLEVLGLSDTASGLPEGSAVDDMAATRAATDEVLDRIGGSSGGASPASPSAGVLSAVETVRAGVDAQPGGSLQFAGAAAAAVDGYRAITDDYWGGVEGALDREVDDADILAEVPDPMEGDSYLDLHYDLLDLVAKRYEA